ncbi:MAG: hypothetical protein IJW67_02620, partial [Blautia sp.]|nr:hypothetical protein [Blautia sp.]
GAWTQTIAPSCTEEGEEERVCRHNASHIETRSVAVVDHSWDDGVVTKKATCEEEGEKTYTCMVGGETRTEAIPATGHAWDDGVITTEPTCTEKGVRTFTCANDATHTRTEDVDALGHDWGAWEVTKEPTETEDGEETRTCSRCGESESRPIPHLVAEYRNTEGDGSSWEKGSTESLIFVFKRSIHDETTFSHFTGIWVDGETVDPDNYSAVSGSVVITLMPAYLETLSAGGHTLMALFDDANDVTVNFTVTEKEVAPPDDTDKTDTDKTDTEKTDTDKTDSAKTDTQKTNTTDTSKTAVQATDVKAPKTGDTSNTEVWAILLTVSFLSLIISLILRRRYSR